MEQAQKLKQTQKELELKQAQNNKAWQDNGHNYKLHITNFIDEKKEKLIDLAIQRGVKKKDIDEYIETETLIDFDIDNLINIMIKEKILTKENGYDDLSLILNPSGIDAVKKRRTEKELD